MHVFKYLELRSAKEDKVRGGGTWTGRKLSELRSKQRQYNGGTSTPSTLSPADSSINNSEEVRYSLLYIIG